MRAFLLFFFISLYTSLSGQIPSQIVLKDSINFKNQVKGYVKHVVRWNDKSGVNYLVLTEVPRFTSSATISSWGQDCKEENCYDKELYAYHFLNTDSLLWKVSDYVRACSADNIVEFRNNATHITDLDKNGIAETWLMYSLTCTSDVSPRTLKLIMHQANTKHIIRGTSQPAKNMLDQELGGKFLPDVSFAGLSTVFKTYARNLWKKNLYDY